MKNSLLASVLALLFSINFSQAQDNIERDTGINLVPNPSFEKLRKKSPDLNAEPYVAYRNYLSKWASPTKTTPDLVFNINDGESDQARTGKTMVGILTHNPISKRSDTWREYAQVKLKETLKEGDEMLLEFWVKRHRQANMASNNLGVFLGKRPIVEKTHDPITDLDLVLNETNIINPDLPEWVKISGTFIAQGGERFLIIGNFYNNENTTFKSVKNLVEPAWENPYYLLDDVSLRTISTTEPEIVEEPVFENEPLEKGQVIRLDKIYFDFDKWDLLAASFEQLNDLTMLLQKYPSMKIAIHGHTDSRGSDAYNHSLSENRARAVHEYLLTQMIDASRLEFEGFGESRPVDTNDSDEGRQNNRRVEFVILELEEENVMVGNE